jgi:hypothetical protein
VFHLGRLLPYTLESLARGKRSSLLQKFVTYGHRIKSPNKHCLLALPDISLSGRRTL